MRFFILLFKNFIKKILPENFILCFWHYPKAVLAAFLYNFPAKKLIVIGVAGTKGKTTSCSLISQILEKGGKKTAVMSTAILKIGEKQELNKIKMTTPCSLFLQRFIKKAVKAGCRYLILETSSHALVQHRVFGIPYQVVVLTNMMPDHLEYHKTAKDYSESHKKMFTSKLKYLIINSDDFHLKSFLDLRVPNSQTITYGLKNKKTILAKDIYLNTKGSIFTIEMAQDSIKVNLPLLGKFNIYNALAGAAVGISQDINLTKIKNRLEKVNQIPGRVEKIDAQQNFEIIVDYAHSPESLDNFFKAILPLKKTRMITVFGACGERDARKRPLMGKIIAQNSDYIIITNDDPYGEDPEKIAKQVLAGIENKDFNRSLFKILDRKIAIKKAFTLAKQGDLVLILGKGAEQWQVFKDKKIPWDDRKIAKELVLGLGNN